MFKGWMIFTAILAFTGPCGAHAQEPVTEPAQMPAPASAQEQAPTQVPATVEKAGWFDEFMPPSLASAGLFAGGAITALLAHESCHLLANGVFGNKPQLQNANYLGFVPFPAISSNIYCDGEQCYHGDGARFGGGPKGFYTISTAGLECQQIGDEIILTANPELRFRPAPFEKGMLALNTLLSIGYALSNWTGTEPYVGDLATADRTVRTPRGIVALSVFVPAVLDIVRYFLPGSNWAIWASRTSKFGLIGLTFAT